MYWPISTPRVYAARSSRAQDRTLHSQEHIRDADSYMNLPRAREHNGQEALSEEDKHNGDLPPPTPQTPYTPGINSVDLDALEHLALQDKNGNEAVQGKNQEDDSIEFLVERASSEAIQDLCISRSGHLFAVITATSMTIWQTKPTSIIATVVRSAKSLSTYGHSIALCIRPDSAIFVVQTTLGFLITYSMATDPDARVYKPHFAENTSVSSRRQSNFTGTRAETDRITWGPGEGGGVHEISVRFRMVIKVDAAIHEALALEDELVVATKKPPAMQCIRWTPDSAGSQTHTELLRKMTWLPKDASIIKMAYNRPMNLAIWITQAGCAYAVQRISSSAQSTASEIDEPQNERRKSSTAKKLFRGYGFHNPSNSTDCAIKTAINARFSLIAVGCVDGSIHMYTAKDYVGNIPLSHKHSPSVSRSTTGALTFLAYSPDGYCLFAGYEYGWATWSVYGKPGSSSFHADRKMSYNNGDGWLTSIKNGVWLGNGCEILLAGDDDRLWLLEFARSAVTGCYASANISRTILQTSTSIMVYQGYDVSDLASISAEASLWHTAQIPSSYLANQWPIRCSVISTDGRYVAVAGRRGLAHYSVSSGRWKTFLDDDMENEFQVRGGMCWHGHILVAAVEAGDAYGLQLYARETALDNSLVVHSERLPAPVVLIALSGHDSLLVYTHDNSLYHFIFTTTGNDVGLVQVGQIAFNGIVRSPARVRGLSWLLPEAQIHDGDPSQDVAVATVLFLVDGKLVLLQPSLNEEQKLKYDMRVIAQNVEYYLLVRDHIANMSAQADSAILEVSGLGNETGLQDSLWMFDGSHLRVWTYIQDVLKTTSSDIAREVSPTVYITADFYPLSILLEKGIMLGIESDIVQRRDVNFSAFRFSIRTQLFIPQILRFHLAHYDTSSALHLAHEYRDLEFLPHALEVLLHDVLDEEVDTAPPPETALLPGVLSFLSSFPQYLDIVVQCTRKTEVRSWRTLFAYLPPPAELFEESLQLGALKTAGGYLLVLHTFEELGASSEQLVRLLGRARDEGDWELCKELARFLTALDETGQTLREALELVNMKSPQERTGNRSFLFQDSTLKIPRTRKGVAAGNSDNNDVTSRKSDHHSVSSVSPGSGQIQSEKDADDYFLVT